MYKYLPESPSVGSLLPSARNEATSIDAKEPSDACCRGTRPSSPKHDPTATGHETLAPKQPLTSNCLVCYRCWSCNDCRRQAWSAASCPR
jgi:hypothetical protein